MEFPAWIRELKYQQKEPMSLYSTLSNLYQ